MGNLLSILWYIPTAVIFYKCPPKPDFDFPFSDQFLCEEDPFVFLLFVFFPKKSLLHSFIMEDQSSVFSYLGEEMMQQNLVEITKDIGRTLHIVFKISGT